LSCRGRWATTHRPWLTFAGVGLAELAYIALLRKILGLNSLVDRSLRDLHLSKTNIGAQEFFAAGVPWYATLFGRDSLIASLQTLACDPGIAEH
jgi:glycogen debranching enzyme